MSETQQKTSWLEAGLAGLPHVLFGLLVALPILSHGRLAVGSLWRLPVLMFFAMLGVVFIFTLERPWPRWLASWIGYAMVMALRLPLYSSDAALLTDVALAALLLWLLVVVAVTLWLVGRDRLSGVLAALALVPMLWSRLGLATVNPDVVAPLFIGIAVLTAVIAALIALQHNRWTGVWMALGLNLIVSVAVTYAIVYHSPIPSLWVLLPQAPIPLVVFASFAFRMLVSSVLVTGSFWGWSLWDRGRSLLVRS
jgi:hypothetical protein